MTQKHALAIHDISCVGRCSLTVALPVLSSVGIETSVLPTAVLSTQTGGFEGYTFLDLTDEMTPIEQHWKRLGLKFDAVYTGFLGSVEQTGIAGEILDDFRRKGEILLVDPVIADSGKLYPVFPQEMVQGMRALCRKATLIVPNRTEAALLLEESYSEGICTETAVRNTLRRLADLAGGSAVLTGVSLAPGRLGAASYDATRDAFSYSDGSFVDRIFHGTGDAFASALLAALMNTSSLERAVEIAVWFTHRCIERTVEAGRPAKFGPCFEPVLPELIHVLGLEPTEPIEI